MTAESVTVIAVKRTLAGTRRDIWGTVFSLLLLGALLLTLIVLITLLVDQLSRALPVFQERGLDFLTSPLSPDPSKAGVQQGLVGSILIGVLVSILCFPLGILTAVYLEEYAPANKLTRFININIRNLAGVPSIVYGLLGLTVFVAFLDAIGFPNNGRNIIAGAATLTALILPIVIITSAEALRAVPVSLREGGYGIGSSRWQVTRQLVLPSARPGILTGTILALARALGETAPLLLAGAVLGTYSTAGTLGDLLTGPYTVLPMTVYDWARRPQEEFRALTSAAIVVLLAVTLTFNALAILLRNRYQKSVVMDPQAPDAPPAAGPATQETVVTTEVKPLTVDVGAARSDAAAASLSGEEAMSSLPTAISLRDVSVFYGAFRAIKDVSIDIPKQRITAFIGPSGCGKSTLLRSINRMNDLVPTARVEGSMLFHGEDLYAGYVDPVEVRRRIGMVFQKANPFPKSIYDNVAFGPRVNGMKGKMDDIVEESLRRAALWDDVKDKLKQSGMALSGGQQQRLCIARAIATSPDVILMDEPCSALDPRSTLQIEELMLELKQNYTIVIVTHNMQQAARASDFTVFLTMDQDRAGYVVERGNTLEIFTNPKDQLTEDYVSGRFG